MSHNFKPGDLALTLSDVLDSQEGIPSGSIVELVLPVPAGHLFAHARLLAKEAGWVATSTPGVSAYYANRHLMPLRGDFAPEQQKSQEVVA
jgi:hypothetical protein